MSTITTKLKEEFFALLPPTIFFFVALHIVALIHSLMLKAEGIPPLTSVSVAVAALLLGKAVLIADMLPAINRFPERPLIYNVVWKTAIYMLVSPNSKPNHQPNHHLTTKPTPNTMKKHPLIHTILPFAIGSVVGSGTVLQAAEADSRQAAIFKTANALSRLSTRATPRHWPRSGLPRATMSMTPAACCRAARRLRNHIRNSSPPIRA